MNGLEHGYEVLGLAELAASLLCVMLFGRRRSGVDHEQIVLVAVRVVDVVVDGAAVEGAVHVLVVVVPRRHRVVRGLGTGFVHDLSLRVDGEERGRHLARGLAHGVGLAQRQLGGRWWCSSRRSARRRRSVHARTRGEPQQTAQRGLGASAAARSRVRSSLWFLGDGVRQPYGRRVPPAPRHSSHVGRRRHGPARRGLARGGGVAARLVEERVHGPIEEAVRERISSRRRRRRLRRTKWLSLARRRRVLAPVRRAQERKAVAVVVGVAPGAAPRRQQR